MDTQTKTLPFALLELLSWLKQPVYCIKVSKNHFLFKYTQNQLTVQLYTKPVYWLMMKGMYMDRTSRNVHGRTITKVRLCELCAKCVQTVTVQVYTKLVDCTHVHKTSLWYKWNQ